MKNRIDRASICKVLCHHGVDSMLKTALGPELYVVDPLFPPAHEGFKETEVYRMINPVKVTKDCEALKLIKAKTWDIFIVDDTTTLSFMLKHIQAKKLVWYVHGTYDTAPEEMKQTFIRYLREAHVIFPSFHKRGRVEKWFGKTQSIVLPISLPPKYFRDTVRMRNGKILIPGGSLTQKTQLYPGREKAAEVIESLQHLGPGKCHTAGYGFDILPKQGWLGFVPGLRYLNHYSGAAIVNTSPSPGFCQLEMMAAGVPVVMLSPKEGFPETGKLREEQPFGAYVSTTSPRDYIDSLIEFIHSDEKAHIVGASGRRYLLDRFPWNKYKETLRYYLDIEQQ